jgi:FSR family fosmidomycin resistance protein-like MFS transporter
MSPFRNRKLLSLALTHFVVDFYSGALPLILAAQTTPLHMTQGQVGLIAFVYSLTTSLGQPLFGLVADTVRAPLVALGGMLWQAVFIGLSGLAGRFDLLLGLVAIGGLGSAAFHPSGAGGVPRISTQEQRGGSMSVFLLGGTSGYALGPLAAGFLLNTFGPHGTLILAGVAGLASTVLVSALRRLRYEGAGDPHTHRADSPSGAARALGIAALVSVGLLALVIMFRGWASLSVSTYLPQLFLQQGKNVQYAGDIAFVISLGAAGGALAAGFLSDRVGRHTVIAASMLLSGPMLYGLVHSQGAWMLLSALALGFCTNASLPLTILLGQEIMPDRPGVMTGLTLGFTFIAGGIGAAITGDIAERTGLLAVFGWLPLLLVLGGVAALALAASHRRRIVALAVD